MRVAKLGGRRAWKTTDDGWTSERAGRKRVNSPQHSRDEESAFQWKNRRKVSGGESEGEETWSGKKEREKLGKKEEEKGGSMCLMVLDATANLPTKQS